MSDSNQKQDKNQSEIRVNHAVAKNENGRGRAARVGDGVIFVSRGRYHSIGHRQEMIRDAKDAP